MHRLALLFFALLIGIWGLVIARGGEPTLAVARRDSLVLAVMAALLFALAAIPPLQRIKRSSEPSISAMPRALIALGLTLGLGGGALAAYALSAGIFEELLPWFLLAWGSGLLLMAIASLWPDRLTATALWSVQAAQSFVRHTHAEQPPATPGDWPSRRARFVILLLLTGLAALVRLWTWEVLPEGCSTAGCASANHALHVLRQKDWQSLWLQASPLYTTLVAGAFGLLGPGLEALRWIGLALGTATIPLLFLATARLVQPGTALLATLLLIFSPWHIELSRYPELGTLLLPLLLCAFWLRWWASDQGGSPRWAMAGLLAGITTLAAPPPLALALFLWLALVPPLAPWRMRLLYWLALLAAALPRMAALLLFLSSPDESGAVAENLQWLVVVLLADAPLLNGGFALLAFFGLVYMLRFLRWAPAFFVVVGTVLVGLVSLTAAGPMDLSTWIPLLAIFSLSAVVAVDQLAGHAIHFWSPLLRPAASLAIATLLILILLGAEARGNVDNWAGTPGFAVSRAGIEHGVGEYLNRVFQESVDNGGMDATLTFVPLELLNHPATQLSAGGILPFAQRTVALDAVEHLPFVGSPFATLPTDGDLRYVIPENNLSLLQRLSQLYPSAFTEIIVDESSGRVLAYVVSVSRDEIDAKRGLPTFYYAGLEAGAPEDALWQQASGPLDFVWDEDAPVAAPFNLLAQGVLYAPDAGLYRFEADSDADANLRLEVGSAAQSWTPINSADDHSAGEVELAQGYYPLRLTYASDAGDARLSIRWQRPGGKWEPIPREALFDFPVDSGLLVTYYAADSDLMNLAAAAPMAQRREPILLAGPLLAESAVAVWQAKVAAPVEGVYGFSIEANGRYQLWLNDALVLGENDPILSQRQAEVYLPRGWHNLSIRYHPVAGSPLFQLAWQTPGGQGGAIPAQSFAPYEPAIDMSGLALPEAPAPMTTPSLASSVAPDHGAPAQFQISSATRPSDLPELPLEELWRTGSCGTGDAQFQQPRGVVLLPEQNRLYVADAANGRLVVYDLVEGQPLQIYADERLIEPFDLGRTLLGDVYLLDATAQQIFRLDVENERLEQIPLETAFYRPRGLGVEASGMLLVADTGGGRVVLLSAQGQVITQFGGRESPLAIGQPVDALALPNGSIWAVTAEDGFLWRLDRGEGQAATAPSDTFTAPHFAGLNSSSFFLTDPARRLILYYNASGQAVAQFSHGGFSAPVGIDAIDADANLLLAVTDSAACTLSLWAMPLDALP